MLQCRKNSGELSFTGRQYAFEVEVKGLISRAALLLFRLSQLEAQGYRLSSMCSPGDREA